MQPLFEHRLYLAGYQTRALELEGDGPPLLLLHGYSDSADTWRILMDRLAREGPAGAGRRPARVRHLRRPESPRAGAGPAPPLRGRRGGVDGPRRRGRGVRQLAGRAGGSAAGRGRRPRPGGRRARGAGGAGHGPLVPGDRTRPAAAHGAGRAGADPACRAAAGGGRGLQAAGVPQPARDRPARGGHLRLPFRRPGHHRTAAGHRPAAAARAARLPAAPSGSTARC